MGLVCYINIFNFNPRSREGSDQIDNFLVQAYLISIHAPAKGATIIIIAFQFLSADFNPRSREGSDPSSPLAVYLRIEFQSTLPRRERRNESWSLICYNIISIHAPAKGATRMGHKKMIIQPQFQSTLPRRERRSADITL